MMNLKLFIFMKNAVTECLDTICNDVLQWEDEIADELENITGGAITYINLPSPDPNISALGITSSPTLVFIDADTQKSITRLVGSQITQSNFNRIVRELNTAQYLPDTGNYNTQSGYAFGAIGESSFGLNPFGFSLFDFNLPPVAYLIGAVLTGYKAVDTPSALGRAVFGSTSAYLLYTWNQKRVQ